MHPYRKNCKCLTCASDSRRFEEVKSIIDNRYTTFFGYTLHLFKLILIGHW